VADLTLRYPSRTVASRVRIAAGGLDHLGAFVALTSGAIRAIIITDRNVAPLYLARARRSLRAAGVRVEDVVLPAGERTKQARPLALLWDRFAALGLGRGDAVVALGGGVIGDLAGFAAATWLRGIAWIGVPTTVLAQVDSSVGGKTGIDLAAAKNLSGAFHQPAGVLVDPGTLETLPARQRRAGLVEVVKMGMAVDASLFRWVEGNAAALASGEIDTLGEAVVRSIRVKARVVTADERETEGGPRMALNYGHTLGHALEAACDYRGILHGEAVALGMRVAARLSTSLAGLDVDARARQDALLDRLGVARRAPRVPFDRVLAAMRQDKKRVRRGVRWVLTPRIGHASVPRLIPSGLVRAACREAWSRPARDAVRSSRGGGT
jgi:3-dehydroquinate synthase